MPAQNGSSILLQYSPGHAQQSGGSIVLEYRQSVSTTRRVSSSTRGVWGPSVGNAHSLRAPHPATENLKVAPSSPWGVSKALGAFVASSWNHTSILDRGVASPWGAFGALMVSLFPSSWTTSTKKDSEARSPWDKLFATIRGYWAYSWVGSTPVDVFKIGAWRGSKIPQVKIADFVHPYGGSLFFSVIGGEQFLPVTLLQLIAQDYVPGVIDASFSSTPYKPTFLGDPAFNFNYTEGGGNFIIGTGTKLVASEVEISSAVDSTFHIPWGKGKRVQPDTRHPWVKYSRRVNPEWGIVTPPGGPGTDPNGTIIVPVLREYIVLNTVQAITVDQQVELPVQSVTLSLDHDSWAWGFSASLPMYCKAWVMPTGILSPIELDLIVNGESYRVVVEKVSTSRSFGKSSLSISGRGLTAYLSSPYSPNVLGSTAVTKTSQQLFEDALTTNGVSLGWTVDWGIPAWDVPANIWTKTGSYIDVVSDITSAVDAYIRPDPFLKSLSVLSKYPLMPKDWASSVPDIVLPSSVVVVEGIEWIENPNYNGVYVSGTLAGVNAHVLTYGTVGDFLAPSKTHALITHEYAAREAGRAILGASGLIAMVTLSLPVLEETGIIKVGSMVKYVDGSTVMFGLVRGLNITTSGATIRQSLEVEVHA